MTDQTPPSSPSAPGTPANIDPAFPAVSRPEDFCGYPAGWVPPPHGLSGMLATFGVIHVENGQIVSPKNWESASMVSVPDLPGAPRKLYCNKQIVAPLRMALERCVALGDGYAIHTLGCFAPRAKRVNGDLSVHSWGAAVDINADSNPLAPAAGKVAPVGAMLAGKVLRDIPEAWVQIFREVGWTWGGLFNRPDPMHFQWCAGY